MSTMQRMLETMHAQLRGLQTTAKLLIGAMMVILVMALLLVATYAGRPSMVSLPVQLDPEARQAALAHLEQAGIPHDEREGELRVPAEQKYTALAQLTTREVITSDQIDFDSLIEQDSPFLTRDQNDRRWLVAKMNMLSSLITQFEGVQRARVMIDQPRRAGFGSRHVPATASVMVVPRGDALGARQAQAIALLVAGSHPGLASPDVKVIDAKHGVSHVARGEEEAHTGRYLELKQAAERDVRSKIEHLLAFIPNVRVAVNAIMDARKVEERRDDYEEPRIGPLESETRNLESRSQAVAGEPGLAVNTGVSLSTGGTRGTQMTDERSRERTRPVFPSDAQHILDHKGYALKVNATVSVPRSYFVTLYRADRNEPDAEPDDAALDPVINAESARIRAAVEPLIDTAVHAGAVPGVVRVTMIPDLLAMLGPLGPDAGAAGPVGAFDGGGGLPAGLVRYLGLIGLSLLSLAMMFLMVRKAGVHAQLPTADEIVGSPPPLTGDQSEVVGEAIESAPPLEGVELDDDALRRKQMLTQISDMVKQNPDEVASLLRRWIRVEA